MNFITLLVTALLLPALPAAQATPVQQRDVLAQFIPSISLSQQAFGNVQC